MASTYQKADWKHWGKTRYAHRRVLYYDVTKNFCWAPKGTEILTDVDATSEFWKLVRHASAISEETFFWHSEDTVKTFQMNPNRHLTLLVHESLTFVYAYCTYTYEPDNRCLWLNEMAVLKEFR